MIRRPSLKIITPLSPLAPVKQSFASSKKLIRRHQTDFIQPREALLPETPDRPDTTSPFDVFCDSRLSFPSSTSGYVDALFEGLLEEDLVHKDQLRQVKESLDDYIQELQDKVQAAAHPQTEIDTLAAQNQILREQIASLTKLC